MADTTGDDPIVCEIPVHLVEHLRGNIHLVQFPLRPAYRPMRAAPFAARIKPENQLLQLDFENTSRQKENFDADAEDYLKQKQLRLTSTLVPALSNHAVGVFRQGQLHLTPISSIYQMRPSFAHIDAAAAEEEEDMDERQEEESKQDTTERKEVQFQFKKKPSDRAFAAMQNSYAFKRQQIAAEKWKELKIVDPTSDEHEEEFENLFSEREEEVTSQWSRQDYLHAMQYRASSTAVAPVFAKTKAKKDLEDQKDQEPEDEDHASGGTVNAMKTLLLFHGPKQVQEVLNALKTDRVLNWKQLDEMFPNQTQDDLLAALRQVAVLVDGRLTAKSGYVCATEPEAVARDAMLKAFVKQNRVQRLKLQELPQCSALAPERLKQLLSDVSELNSETRTWSLLGIKDPNFTKKFPDVARAIRI